MARSRFLTEVKALELETTRAGSEEEDDSDLEIHCDGSLHRLPRRNYEHGLSFEENEHPLDPRGSDTNSRFSLSMTRPYESTSQFLSTLNDHTTPHLAGSQTLKPERTAEFGLDGGTEEIHQQTP